MASTLTRLFSTIGTRESSQTRHLPMLNEINANLSSYYSNAGQSHKKKALMNWYKGIPELTGIANKVARDITSKYHFESVSGTGRNKVLKAEKFAADVGYRRIKFAQAVDKLITGEAYGFIKKITKDTVMKEAQSFMANSNYEMKESKAVLDYAVKQAFLDEDVMTPKDYRYIASSTMDNHYDKYSIEYYTQTVGSIPERFETSEIIRSTFMDVDGKVSGFTPVESIVVQLELTRLMWQNMMSIQVNGGTPDKIFSFENLNPQSPAYKQIKEQLEKYKLTENRHGNMLLTSKVNITDVQQFDKMPFKDVGVYVASVIALQWQVPRSSIPLMLGEANTKDDTGGNSEKGYWDNIEYMQRLDAEIDNTQLWIPHFGVKLVYDDVFEQKNIVEQTALMSKLNNVKLMEEILSTSGTKLTKQKKMKLFGLMDDEVEKAEVVLEPQSTLDKQQPKSATETSDGERNRRKRKSEEQLMTAASRGVANGTGKELEIERAGFDGFYEEKQMESTPSEKVNIETFIKIYNEDKTYGQGPGPRVFMRQNDMFTTLKFKSSDFVYLTIMDNSEIENNKVLLSNLGKLYRL